MSGPKRTSSRGLMALTLGLSLLLAGCSAYHRAVQTGAKALEEGRYEEALAAYESALSLDPRGTDARTGLTQARRGLSTQLVQRGRAALEAGKLEAAADDLGRAIDVDPDNVEAPQLYGQALSGMVAMGNAALQKDDLPGAEARYAAVLRRQASHREARLGMERVKAAWARYHFAQGEAAQRRGKLGNALVEYLRADEERPGVTPARERAAEVREGLRRELTLWVVMPPVEDRADATDVSQRLTAGRVAAVLPKKLPIRVVTEPAPEGGTGVLMDVALERVWAVEDKKVTQKSHTYLAGTRSVANPQRASAEAELLTLQRDDEEREAAVAQQVRRFVAAGQDVTRSMQSLEVCRERARESCEQRYAKCMEKAVDGGADMKKAGEQCRGGCDGMCASEERELARARRDASTIETQVQHAQATLEASRRQVQRTRDALLRLPLTLDEPMHAEHIYDVEHHRRGVHALVTSQLTELGAEHVPPTPVTREAVVESKDDAHRGFERFGILTNPLELRSETELRNALGEEALKALADIVMQRYELHRARWVAAAGRGQVRAGAEDVVEATVRALLLTADNPDPRLMEGLTLGRKLQKPARILGEG